MNTSMKPASGMCSLIRMIHRRSFADRPLLRHSYKMSSVLLVCVMIATVNGINFAAQLAEEKRVLCWKDRPLVWKSGYFPTNTN